MQLSDAIRELELCPICVSNPDEQAVTGVYCGDLLSDVLAHAEPGSIWFTIQGHVNIVAVAQLKDVACIVLVNGASPDPQTVAKAKAQGVAICGSDRTAADLCMALAGKI